MDITPALPTGRQVIQRYAPGEFLISGRRYRGPVVVLPDRVMAWPVTSFEALTVADFSSLTGAAIDLLLIGCGARGQPLPGELRRALRAVCPAFEVMDTGAACRTYSAVMAEGRRVAAALLPV